LAFALFACQWPHVDTNAAVALAPERGQLSRTALFACPALETLVAQASLTEPTLQRLSFAGATIDWSGLTKLPVTLAAAVSD
jgi:hypothetical protein